jgi:hypothetical protein
VETFINIEKINSLKNEDINKKYLEIFENNFIFISVARLVPLKNQL